MVAWDDERRERGESRPPDKVLLMRGWGMMDEEVGYASWA